MPKKGEKNTRYLLGKGDKERHKEEAVQKKRELKKNRNILKVNATALKRLTFLEATCFCFSTQKQQFKLLYPIHFSVTWNSHFPSPSFLMLDLSAVAILAVLMHLVQWILSKFDYTIQNKTQMGKKSLNKIGIYYKEAQEQEIRWS